MTFQIAKSRNRAIAKSLALLFVASAGFAAETPIRYSVSFPRPQTHFVSIEARIPTDGREEVELMMPVWTPGSYLVREYSRHVQDFVAQSPEGKSLEVEKSRKNRWRIRTAGAGEVVVRYDVYSRQMSVQSNYVDPEFALLNGAATFMTRVDALNRPHEVLVRLPKEWRTSVSGMSGDRPNHFRAADFDTLVDSPIVAGNPKIYTFKVDGKDNLLVNVGDDRLWDGERAARDVEKIVRQHRDFWGFLPYERYVFLNLIVNTGGGLEHKNSTVLMTRPLQMKTRKSYLRWLDLVSHEFFHTWNVKRLRPAALGPFDYENEVYTPDLWISEGFTDYYSGLLNRRAELLTDTEYLRELWELIEKLQTTPGRLEQPVDTASLDAWIRHYRADEISPNVAISYYTKGAVIGFLLDAQIRRVTEGRRSLDDVMRAAYQRYAGPNGFTSEQFEAVVAESGGPALGEWLHHVTRSTEELDYKPALEWFGLKFTERKKSRDDDDDKEETAWLGIETKNDAGRFLVTQIRSDSTAFLSGLSVDDEIVAIDDLRVTSESWKTRLELYHPGDEARMTVARRDRILSLPITFEKEPKKMWKLIPDPDASGDQKRHREAWLKGSETRNITQVHGVEWVLASIAQLVEQRTLNPLVPGSSPGGGTKFLSRIYTARELRKWRNWQTRWT